MIKVFTGPSSYGGTAGFVVGVCIILVGWARLGLIIEVGGLFMLLGRYVKDAVSWVTTMGGLARQLA